MNALSILTLIAAGLIVGALAVYLIAVAVLLRKTLATLGTINDALHSIAQRVEPLEPTLEEINTDLTAVRDGLAGTLEGKARSGRQVAS